MAQSSLQGWRDAPVGPSTFEVPMPAFLTPAARTRGCGVERRAVPRQSGGGAGNGRPGMGTRAQQRSATVPLGLGSGATVTTLLVHNVNRRLTPDVLMQVWPQRSYKYDLLYSVYDWTKKRCSGRVFLNFATPKHAAEFHAMWDKVQHAFLNCRDKDGQIKPLHIERANRQGFSENVREWQWTMRTQQPARFCPVVFIGGQPMQFWQFVDAIQG